MTADFVASNAHDEISQRPAAASTTLYYTFFGIITP